MNLRSFRDVFCLVSGLFFDVCFAHLLFRWGSDCFDLYCEFCFALSSSFVMVFDFIYSVNRTKQLERRWLDLWASGWVGGLGGGVVCCGVSLVSYQTTLLPSRNQQTVFGLTASQA